jgi:hypothetical protein
VSRSRNWQYARLFRELQRNVQYDFVERLAYQQDWEDGAVSGAGGEGWASTPPAWALPVTVAGDLVLVRQGGVLVSVGAVCAYPVGFEFYLTFGFDLDRAAEWRSRTPGGRVLSFHARTPSEEASAARIVVGFAGRMVDSVACMNREVALGEPVLRFAGGDAGIPSYAPVLRAESRWWVSPLPPPGLVEFSVYLHRADEPDGTASLDAAGILEAASRTRTLWPAPESGPL